MMFTLSNASEELYLPIMADIVRVDDLTEFEKRFIIEMPNKAPLDHQPGQFVEVSIFGFGEAPISISSSPTRGPQFELTVRRTGRLTDKMHRLGVGDRIGIRGPFGQGFPVRDYSGKDMLFICGGIGLAPLKSLIDYCVDKKADFGRLMILYGTRTPADILFADEVIDWQQDKDVEFSMTVDRPTPEWQGNSGVITTLIPDLDLDQEKTIATIVGPPVMYKFVLMSLRSKRIPEENIYMSLERRMKCGVGKCGHCQINGSYVCQDGPVYHLPFARQLEEAI
jgi:sulfhydrogenase subunit gamma (sulfur reductase)